MAIADYTTLRAAVLSYAARSDSAFTAMFPTFVSLTEARIYDGAGRPGEDVYSPPLRSRAMEASTSENGGREGGERPGGFGGRDRERGEGGRRGGRNRSRGRGGDRRPREGGQPGGQPSAPEGSGSTRPVEQSPSSSGGGSDSSVKNLIDLVE
jgi:hypothetical protein